MELPELQIDPVPARYRGVWRRSLLATPDLRDTATIVFWLQTERWHADIRLPAGRPDFSDVEQLADCSAEQLEWLCHQQGFAGITQVDTSVNPEICSWHRVVDYQSPSTTADAGTMEFEADVLIEKGVHAEYLEHWHKLPDSDQGFAVTTESAPSEPLQMLLVAGSYVMRVRERQAGSGVALEDILDFEISFGVREADDWRVLHSTLPWLEGQHFALQ
jgi:hypothetical protein